MAIAVVTVTNVMKNKLLTEYYKEYYEEEGQVDIKEYLTKRISQEKSNQEEMESRGFFAQAEVNRSYVIAFQEVLSCVGDRKLDNSKSGICRGKVVSCRGSCNCCNCL